ncbi:hypothetical protein CCACVL1_22496, partial [Corchorus capsularis]
MAAAASFTLLGSVILDLTELTTSIDIVNVVGFQGLENPR